MQLTYRKSNKYKFYVVFGLTRSGLELIIYRTRVENANHYTTVIIKRLCLTLWLKLFNFNVLFFFQIQVKRRGYIHVKVFRSRRGKVTYVKVETGKTRWDRLEDF